MEMGAEIDGVILQVHPVNCRMNNLLRPVLVIGATGRPGAAVACPVTPQTGSATPPFHPTELFDLCRTRFWPHPLAAGSDRKMSSSLFGVPRPLWFQLSMWNVYLPGQNGSTRCVENLSMESASSFPYR